MGAEKELYRTFLIFAEIFHGTIQNPYPSEFKTGNKFYKHMHVFFLSFLQFKPIEFIRKPKYNTYAIASFE